MELGFHLRHQIETDGEQRDILWLYEKHGGKNKSLHKENRNKRYEMREREKERDV